MIGNLRQARHLLRPIDAINGVKNLRRRISILKQALQINCDLKAISRKEADMIGQSPAFPSSKTSQVGTFSTFSPRKVLFTREVVGWRCSGVEEKNSCHMSGMSDWNTPAKKEPTRNEKQIR